MEDSPNKTIVEQAQEALMALQEKIEISKQLVAKEEALKAERILSGRADAGNIPPKPVEETPEEYAKRIMQG